MLDKWLEKIVLRSGNNEDDLSFTLHLVFGFSGV